MANNTVLLKKKNTIAWITINRENAMNALNREVIAKLSDVITELEQDDNVKIIILKGAGNKAFVGGADIKGMSEMTSTEIRLWMKETQAVFNRIENIGKIVVAVINGYALGGGCELAMACDVRIATTKSKFGLPETGLGLIPGFAGTQRLPRLVGKGIAKEMLFTGMIVNAEEACNIGLVNRVVSEIDLDLFVNAFIESILKKSSYANALCKRAVNEGMEMSILDGMTNETELFVQAFLSKDKVEGIAAFVEKRQPNFLGE